jgi:hypothetical protein
MIRIEVDEVPFEGYKSDTSKNFGKTKNNACGVNVALINTPL